MKLRIIKEKDLETLKENIRENKIRYKKKSKGIIKKEDLTESKIEVTDFKLDTSEKISNKSDFKNIKLFYSNMKHLTDSQASDERLWAGLCHDRFWEYMQYRWPSDNLDTIIQRYFFGKSHPLMMNGLSRLWWTARFTYNESLKDPFELTKYICKDLNGRGYPLFAVGFSRNKTILKIFLKTLMEFEKKRKLSREEFNKVKERMVLWGGIIILDTLTEEQLAKKLNDYLNENFPTK